MPGWGLRARCVVSQREVSPWHRGGGPGRRPAAVRRALHFGGAPGKAPGGAGPGPRPSGAKGLPGAGGSGAGDSGAGGSAAGGSGAGGLGAGGSAGGECWSPGHWWGSVVFTERTRERVSAAPGVKGTPAKWPGANSSPRDPAPGPLPHPMLSLHPASSVPPPAKATRRASSPREPPRTPAERPRTRPPPPSAGHRAQAWLSSSPAATWHQPGQAGCWGWGAGG